MPPQNPSTSIPQGGVCTITILSDGEVLSGAYHLLSVVVQKEVNRIPSATLLLSDSFTIGEHVVPISDQDTFAPGKAIEVKAGYSSNEETIFKGIVVKHSIKVRATGIVLVIECRHIASKMTVAPKSRYFADVKDSDAFETLLGEYSIEHQVEQTTVQHEEIVQYEATDWDFMLCRAEANGMLCIVGDDDVAIAPPDLGADTTLTMRLGEDIIELDAEIDARLQYRNVGTVGWDASSLEARTGAASEPTIPQAGNLSAQDLADVMNVEEYTLKHDGTLASQELQEWADAKMLKQRLAKIRGQVRANGTSVAKPGQIIELIDVGERFAGKLYVTAVRQQIEQGSWQTIFQFGVNPEWFAQTYDVQQPLTGALLPPIQGLHIGIATALAGDPMGEDRIRVRLPVIHESDEGIWSRICTLDAGANRGSVFRPEVGDEVIVGFLNNDPRHAVILGMCHSSHNPAPISVADDNNEKGYTSRNGMKLLFDDGENSILMQTASGNLVKVNDGEQGVKITDQSGNEVKLSPTGMDITCMSNINITASGSVSVTFSGGTFTLGADGASISSAGRVAVSAGTVELTGGTVNMNAAMVQCSGVITAQTVIAQVGVVSPSYTPGAGNIW
jgi:Rhs element Vgr protein